MTMIQPRAAIRLTMGGEDLTNKISPRLVSLTLTDDRAEKADQLEIILHDVSGDLAIPPEGAELTLAFGWERGSNVTLGLVEKGRFKVDDVEHSGPPDQLTIRARSADMTGGFRQRKDKSHRNTTLGEIARTVAADNGWQAKVDATLSGIAVPVLAQSAKSDMALLKELGRKHDASATVKNGVLIFAPIGSGQTASGKALPAMTIRRSDGDRHRYARAKRESGYAGVEAQWHDRQAGQRKTVQAGGAGGAAGAVPKRLKRVHASEADAKAHAEAEAKRNARREASLSLDLAVGNPQLAVEQAVKVQGYKPEIDATQWLVKSVTHRIDGQGGLATSVELEVKA